MRAPDFTPLADTYRFNWPEDGIAVEIDRLREDRADGLICEIQVSSSRPPNPGNLIAPTKFNLVSATSRQSLIRSLNARDPEVDWDTAVGQVCALAIRRWRQGEPVIDLRTVNWRERPRYLLPPFVTYAGPTVLFADGGAGKSLLSLAIAATVASGSPNILGLTPTLTGPVLYLDWEADEYTHAERMDAIIEGCALPEPPPISYQRMYASLPESANDLRRLVAELGAVMVVIDSLGAARAGEPESADLTIRLFNAARSLSLPILMVDHVTKAQSGEPGRTRPFGSTYTHNLARQTFSLVSVQDEGGGELVIAITNHKNNLGRLAPRMGYRVLFETEDNGLLATARFDRCDLRAIPQLESKLPIRQQIAHALQTANHALTTAGIYAAVTAENTKPPSKEVIGAVLRRYRGQMWQRLSGRDDDTTWGLLTTQEEKPWWN